MADRNQYPGPRAYHPELNLVVGTILIDSDGTVASTSVIGASGCARTAEGKYKLSLDESYAGGLKAASFSVTGDGAFFAARETDSSSSASDPHVDFFTKAAADGAAADADDMTIDVVCWLQRRNFSA